MLRAAASATPAAVAADEDRHVAARTRWRRRCGGSSKDWGRSCRHHLLMTRAGRANERRTLKQMMLPIAAEKVGRETHTPRTGRFAGAWLIASGLSKPRGRLFNQSRTSRSSVRPASPTHSYAVFKGDPMLCSRATDGRSASKCQGKWPDQTLDHRPDCQWWRQSSEPRTPLGKTPDIRKNLRQFGSHPGNPGSKLSCA